MVRAARVAAFAAVALAMGCGEEELSPVARSPWPRAPVEIVIDDLGVPHVYAQDDEDAFYGAGYQMATDRLFQMEMLRRFAEGRTAEVLGEAGYVRDRQSRTFDLVRWGRADAELMRREEPERARLLSAWVAGINARVDEVRRGDAPLPFGYRAAELDFLPERWDEDAPYVVLKGAGFALDRTIEFEIAVTLVEQLYPEAIANVDLLTPAHPVFAVPPEDRPGGAPVADARRAPRWTPRKLPPSSAEEARVRASLRALSEWTRNLPRAAGSNSWAIDGRHTEDGRPLVAGDPHLSFDFFGAPYPLHINSADAGGSFDVAGFAYPGTPGIALGHNRHVMWTATSAFADVTDVWQVERTPGGVRIGDEDAAITVREEVIRVREPGGAVGDAREVDVLYEDVDGFGVLLPNDLMPAPIGGPFLINWTGFSARPSRWFLELNRVASLDDFEDAVDRMREMNYSFVAADQTGIAYRVGVDVPHRVDVSGARGPYRAMDGADAGSLWSGEMLPRSRLPRSRARSRGWVATANNDPFGFTQDGRVDDDPYYYGAFFAPGYRAHRIESELTRLAAQGGVTLGDVQALQADVHSTLADDLLPLLVTAYEHIETEPSLSAFADDPELDAVVTLLAEWDHAMALDAAGPVAFVPFLHSLAQEVLKDDIPLAYDIAVSLQTVFILKVAALAVGGGYEDGAAVLQDGLDQTLLTAAKRTATYLRARLGSDPTSAIDLDGMAFSDVKRVSFDHALGYGVELFERPNAGGEDTINVSQNLSFGEDDATWVSTYVSVERSVGRFADDGVPEVWITMPFTGAAEPGDAASESALDHYLRVEHQPLLFRRGDVEARAARRRELPARD